MLRYLHSSLALASITSFAMLGCGGAPSAAPAVPASAAPSTAAAAAEPASAPASASPAASAPTASAPVASADEKYEDQEEVHGTITLAPQLSKGLAHAKFPKATVSDRDCWSSIMLTGDHAKDYAEIAAKCGAPTGLLEYARPAIGKLHHKHDQRDTYALKLQGGMCYRYFGVADANIKDLDILVEKPNGSLVADDKTSQPVAIIEGDKPWCVDEDVEYNFQIAIDGPGTGGYVFGVWARPKK